MVPGWGTGLAAPYLQALPSAPGEIITMALRALYYFALMVALAVRERFARS